jgi:hypothetical protein
MVMSVGTIKNQLHAAISFASAPGSCASEPFRMGEGYCSDDIIMAAQ